MIASVLNSCAELKESNVNLKLTIVDTVGFGDQIDKTDRYVQSYSNSSTCMYFLNSLMSKPLPIYYYLYIGSLFVPCSYYSDFSVLLSLPSLQGR